MTATAVRPAAVAGAFYPGTAAELTAMVDGLLADASPPAQDMGRGTRAPKALIVPHAGYVYSGPVAATAYRLLAEHADGIARVVLLGPAHRVPVRGCAFPTVDAFRTPLGDLPVARDLVASFARRPWFVADDLPHQEEHSLEVHLPFLQRVLGPVEICPVVVGLADAASVADLLELAWGGPETLVVVSTDLSHYHDHRTAEAIDRQTCRAIAAFDLASVVPDRACGAHPLAGLLEVARARSMRIVELDRRTSADTAGPADRVVGYGSFALFETGPPAISDQQGEALLSLAHEAVRAEVTRTPPPDPDGLGIDARRPAFVSLYRHGELRGCVGSLEAKMSLPRAVVTAARSACHDPRLRAVTAAELDELDVSISVLGPLERLDVSSRAELIEALRPGVHGLVLEEGSRRSTFLPSVWASLPDADAFVDALLAKGGWPSSTPIGELTVHRYASAHLGADR